MIEILVKWEKYEEIDRAHELSNELTEYFREQGLFTGFRTSNNPHKTFGIRLKNQGSTQSTITEEEK